MGIRGELFSTRVGCEGRTYFFNVKENRMGDVFLTIVESKPTEADNFERRSIVIFKDDVKSFLKAFKGALGFMEGAEGGLESLRFEPRTSTSKGPRPRVVPAGFRDKAKAPSTSGSVPEAPQAAEKRRRIVVKRKKESGSEEA
jgi:hypothetical protein